MNLAGVIFVLSFLAVAYFVREWFRALRSQEFKRDLARLQEQRGTCPRCGCKLRRNLSLSGWFQCNALGAPGFQSGDGVGKPSCDFQFFFDPSTDEQAALQAILVARS
jgi:hypothetical protein